MFSKKVNAIMDGTNSHCTQTRPTTAHGHHDSVRESNSHNQLVIQFAMGNDVSLVMPIIKNLGNRIRALHVMDEREISRVGIALHEALLNAIYHGNLELDSELRQEDERQFHDLAEIRRQQAPYRDRQVVVRFVLSGNAATFVIRDEGMGFDVNAVADPTQAENIFRVGGRGLLMIRSFMDTVHHNVCGNQITMVKKISHTADLPHAAGSRVIPDSRPAEKVAEVQILL